MSRGTAGRDTDSLMLRVSSAVASHPGLRREKNEDAFCVRPDLGLYMVADGMGGHAAGEVASRLAVDAVEAFIDDTKTADLNRTWPFPYDPSISLDGNRLKAALRLANRRIAAEMQRDPALRGMATTAVAALISADAVTVAHVGDSRIYRSRAHQLQQITQDHSWVGEQVRAGSLTEADARQHPWRNVVTRALSGGDDPEVDIAPLTVESGDGLLICSDGLTGVVGSDICQGIIDSASSLEDACQALIEAANRAGGPDNITVTLLRIDVA
jgi:serine/threonine protein phosphatase PrpC